MSGYEEAARIAEERRRAIEQLAAGLESHSVAASGGTIPMAMDEPEKARRRRAARRVRAALALIAGGIAALFMTQRASYSSHWRSASTVETIALSCLTPQQAADLARPYLQSNGSAIFPQNELKSITIRARSRELRQARRAIDKFDDARRCTIPPTVAPPATPSAGK